MPAAEQVRVIIMITSPIIMTTIVNVTCLERYEVEDLVSDDADEIPRRSVRAGRTQLQTLYYYDNEKES
jgi:hypothetical protein